MIHASVAFLENKINLNHSYTEDTTFPETVWDPSSQEVHFWRGSWLGFQEWGITKPDTSEMEDFGSRSCCSYLDIQLDWFNAWAQPLSHLRVIILVSLCALQIDYHMHSWDSFFHLLWWTDEVSNFISAAYTDELYFYSSLPIQMTLQCREIIQFYLIINNYSQLLFFQLID